MKWGKKDLRNASKQRLLELGLQKKVFREENNTWNKVYLGGVLRLMEGENVCRVQ